MVETSGKSQSDCVRVSGEGDEKRAEMERMRSKNFELEAKLREYESIMENCPPEALIQTSQANKGRSGENMEQEHNLKVATRTTFKSSSIVLKSPIPRQRKSKSKTSKAERLKSRLAPKCPPPSKEQLEELLQSNSNSNSNSLSSTTSISSSTAIYSNSTSGFSSSRSLAEDEKLEEVVEGGQVEERIVVGTDLKQRLGLCRDSTLGDSSGKWSTGEEHYKLCQCADCRLSGQQIYCQQRSGKDSLRRQQRPMRPPTPPRVAPRKAVSFRSSVEQIGSPSCKPLNDQVDQHGNRLPTFDEQLDWLRFNGQQQVMTNRINDSCDSLHATKDFSLISDQIRPLDCSTPKSSEPPLEKGQQLIPVEVHSRRRTERALASDYTCLCSPDFNCIHNYPERHQQQQQQQHASNQLQNNSRQITKSTPIDDMRDIAISERQKSGAISNELYGRCLPISAEQIDSSQVIEPIASDFSLSKNCVECNNVSTYVNLSNNRIKNRCAPFGQLQPNQSQLVRGSADTSLRNVTNSSGDSNGGYGSREYRSLIRSQQEGIYGNWSNGLHIQPQQQQQQVAETEEQQYQYLTAARRIQQAIEECEMCQQDQRIQQLQANASIISGNNISLKPNGAQTSSSQKQNSTPTIMAHNQHQPIDLSSSKSYHTASSSSLPNCHQSSSASNQRLAKRHTIGNNPSMISANNVSSLSVLPVDQSSSNGALSCQETAASSKLHQPLMVNNSDQVAKANNQPTSANYEATNEQLGSKDLLDSNVQTANIDSSLSSLFVYRHVSDDNQPIDEFDPDSLELSRLTNSNPADDYRVPKATTSKATTAKPSLGNDHAKLNNRATRISWLKTRPKSEYISLSSTTSNISTAPNSVAVKSQPQTVIRSGLTNPQTGIKSAKAPSAACIQVDPDITQSSLARRRHLSNSLHNQQQQQQQQQNGAKRRLLAGSKANSRSSPNIAAAVNLQSATGKGGRNHSRSNSSHNNSSSSSSNVKTIYQCFKNHLLDFTCKSSSSTSSNHKSNASAASSNSLPRNLINAADLQRSKSQQICKPLDADAIQRKSELIRMESNNLSGSSEQLMNAASRVSTSNNGQGQQRNQAQPSGGELKTKLDKALGMIKSLQESSGDLKRELINLNERNRILVDQNQQLIQALRLAELNFNQQQQQHEDRERGLAALVDSNQQVVSSSRDDSKSDSYTACEIELMRRQVNQLNQLCAKLETDLRKRSMESEQQQQINRQLEKLLDGSQCELANVRIERNQIRVQSEKVIIELEARNNELANLRAQLGELERDLSAKQNELLSFQRQLNGREQLLKGKQEELQNLRKQLRRQQQSAFSFNQAQQLEGEVAKLQQQTKSLEEDRIKLQSELELSRAELERLLKVLSDNDDEKFNLTQELAHLQARLETKVKIEQQLEQQFVNGSEKVVADRPVRPAKSQADHADKEAYSVMNNMHLIELALRESINWSMSYWREQAVRAECGAKDNNVKLSGRNVEKMTNAAAKDEQPTVDPETHMRALISRFKIELNNLMGMKKLNIECSSGDIPARARSIDRAKVDSARNKGQCRRKSAASLIPKQAIQITGKHSGLYKIAELTDDDDDDVDEEEEEQAEIKDYEADVDRTPKSSAKNRDPESRMSGGDQAMDRRANLVEGTNRASVYTNDTDDGYRSLSRTSFRSNLVQQLNEIKSRLIDLVDEIESSVRNCLQCEQLDAYRRRQHALVSKLDQLIDNMVERVDSSIDSPPVDYATAGDNYPTNRLTNEQRHDLQPSSSYSSSSCSSSSGTSSIQPDSERRPLVTKGMQITKNNQAAETSENVSDGYEEQVQVIDYERRRGSAHKLGQNNETGQDVKSINLVRRDYEQPAQKRPSVIVNSGASRVETGKNYSNNLCLSRMEPIDFGAMMRNYEQQNGTQIMFSKQNYDKSKLYDLTANQNVNGKASASGSTEHPFNTGQHAPSSSTTSTFSASSHTSSTSSFL